MIDRLPSVLDWSLSALCLSHVTQEILGWLSVGQPCQSITSQDQGKDYKGLACDDILHNYHMVLDWDKNQLLFLSRKYMPKCPTWKVDKCSWQLKMHQISLHVQNLRCMSSWPLYYSSVKMEKVQLTNCQCKEWYAAFLNCTFMHQC